MEWNIGLALVDGLARNPLMLLSLLLFSLSLEGCGVSLAGAVNPEDKPYFKLRECRRSKWKGDVGVLPVETLRPRHPRDVLKVHSRRKRFIAFPKGSTLTIKNALSIPKHSDDWKSLGFFGSLNLALDLPEGHLKLIGTGLHYDDGVVAAEAPESTSNYGTSSYMSYDANRRHYYRGKRSLDQQRKTGFDFIEKLLNKFGLPGKQCMLKAVCERADDPFDFGVFGEIMNLFLSPGYGEGMDEMKGFVEAEELGRTNGTCESLYQDCHVDVLDFLHSGFALLHSGATTAGVASLFS